MLTFLRIIGVANVAIWFGGSVFFTFLAGPAFFSDEMLRILPRPYAGAVAQLMIDRYFLLQQVCGILALAHLAAEWLYAGRPFPRLSLYLILALLAISAAGGLWLAPKMKRLHYIVYSGRYPAGQVESARRSFSRWHGFSQGLNLLALVGIGAHLWRCTRTGDGTWYTSGTKFRG